MTPRSPLDRRRWLAHVLQVGAVGALGPLGLAACRPRSEPLRLGAQVFPAYELLFLARELGHLPEHQVRLIEMPSASASLRALASGALEGACLTLDEVLAARDRGLALSAVLVLDQSMGADALVARPGFGSLGSLRGSRIGVEQTAVGAVMLDAALQQAGLAPADVQLVALSVDEHEAAFVAGRVDAVVTYEPTLGRLLAAGASVLFSSRQVPGRVLDVLALRTPFLTSHAAEVAQAVDAHLRARDAFVQAPQAHVGQLAPRLGIEPAAVAEAFRQLDLPDRERNRAWLAGSDDALLRNARLLHGVMSRAGLVQHPFDPAGLFDARFVKA